MANFKNTTGRDLRVGGQIIRAGESVDFDGDKLPGSLRLIGKGAGGDPEASPRKAVEPAKDGDKAPAAGGGAKDGGKAPAGASGGKAS